MSQALGKVDSERQTLPEAGEEAGEKEALV